MHLIHNNVDYGPLLLGVALTLVALIILGYALIWRKIRLDWREEMLRALYELEEPGSNSGFYKNWRMRYIEAVEAKFDKRIWRDLYRMKKIPPLSVVFASTS